MIDFKKCMVKTRKKEKKKSFSKCCRGNQNTRFVVIYVFFEYLAVYEKFCRRGRPQKKKWRMRIACWLNKAIRKLTICSNYCFSTATIAAITSLNIALYVHCLSFHYSYAINVLVWIFSDNDGWRKERVGGNKEFNLYAWCMCRSWFIEEK